jgi:hypothetical protein
MVRPLSYPIGDDENVIFMEVNKLKCDLESYIVS